MARPQTRTGAARIAALEAALSESNQKLARISRASATCCAPATSACVVKARWFVGQVREIR